MVKLIGVILVLSSLLSLVAGSYIDLNYGRSTIITGNAISNIIAQPLVNLSAFDYIAGAAYSFSIISFIMGIMFLVRV